jgi:predicted XRE-type DNA-binding protein
MANNLLLTAMKEWMVCHTCDNPLCVNPNHLYLGTAQDNMRDRYVRNRHWVHSGESHANTKLTAKQVVTIREMYLQGEYQKNIAKIFGINQAYVSQLCRKERRAHV